MPKGPAPKKTRQTSIAVRPVTPARWDDLETLFGAKGACAGCWCMFWRLTSSEWKSRQGEGNRKALRKLVAAGAKPGLLAYAGSTPIGWIALAPRAAYTRLENSRILAPIDDAPVWSVVCFFIAREHRRRGVTRHLLEGAATFARKQGARILEGYPVEPKKGAMPDVFAYTGVASAFERAGFHEVGRRSATRPIMRRRL